MKKLTLLVSLLTCCTPAQQDWRNNISIDLAAGGDTVLPQDTYTSLGMSYYLYYGISASVGTWNDFYGNVGPYWGVGYSWVPFGD